MVRICKILCKKFCPLLILACCFGLGYARAEGTSTIFENDPKLKTYFSNANSGSSTKTLCPQGYYVSRCGAAFSLGTNLLKGMNKRTTSGTMIQTPDYYSYNTSASDVIHITNLRKFFAAEEPFTYTEQNSNTQKSVSPETYEGYKNQTLSHICTDDTGTLTGIECEKCPGETMVAASTVEIDSNSNKLLWRTWKVHTIADCYTEEFSDNTGTYKYVANNVSAENSSPKPCYYSVNVPGDTLP